MKIKGIETTIVKPKTMIGMTQTRAIYKRDPFETEKEIFFEKWKILANDFGYYNKMYEIG